ncbi:hypothetical protein AL387_gp132 [Salmon gill poxvirus]|uniref:Uncharacterized protein n=1 Tax=Salmon gill poxvirus TaxID=1680908 RepID=A0A0H4XWQ1_9POXV|nr:hypothetical protein AL387_gp132 [Salmon gill poxvirus]AKR04256.1 hypothetical protein SGPV132 [Salmon gill poxvirus]
MEWSQLYEKSVPGTHKLLTDSYFGWRLGFLDGSSIVPYKNRLFSLDPGGRVTGNVHRSHVKGVNEMYWTLKLICLKNKSLMIVHDEKITDEKIYVYSNYVVVKTVNCKQTILDMDWRLFHVGKIYFFDKDKMYSDNLYTDTKTYFYFYNNKKIILQTLQE